MTRKHFEAIAAIIANQFVEIHSTYGNEEARVACESVTILAQELAEKFEEFNPLMNKDRFLIACGVQ